jgi:enoyl-CoA hydratase/carnithine racemase
MIRYETRDAIAWLTLDRPQKLNAMTRGFFAQLEEAMRAADRDPAVRSVIVHGAGRCFSVGGDIDGFGELGDTADRRTYVQEALRAFRTVEEISKPVIAAVHGHALGGGCELTVVSDLVVADETARFGMPETAVGLFPGPGVARGHAQLTLHALKAMIFTGVTLNAREALRAGLVNEVVPDGQHIAKAEEWAALIADRAPLALAAAKGILNSEGWERLPDVVDAVTLLQGSADFAEGIAAFGERRKPEFRGR